MSKRNHEALRRNGVQWVTSRVYDKIVADGATSNITLDADWPGRVGDPVFIAVMGDRSRPAIVRTVTGIFPTPRTRSLFLDIAERAV